MALWIVCKFGRHPGIHVAGARSAFDEQACAGERGGGVGLDLARENGFEIGLVRGRDFTSFEHGVEVCEDMACLAGVASSQQPAAQI